MDDILPIMLFNSGRWLRTSFQSGRFLKVFDFEGVVDCAIVLHTMLNPTAQFVPKGEAERRRECLKNVE